MILLKKVEKNYVYTFEYSAQGVELTDSRPLHRIGENSWVKTKETENATSVLPLVTKNKEINLFASIDKNIIRYAFDSAGNNKSAIKSGDSFNITYVSAVKDDFFIAGYETTGKTNKPHALVLGADGVTRRTLPKSSGYESARFLAAAQKDANTWLLASDGVKMVMSALPRTPGLFSMKAINLLRSKNGARLIFLNIKILNPRFITQKMIAG